MGEDFADPAGECGGKFVEGHEFIDRAIAFMRAFLFVLSGSLGRCNRRCCHNDLVACGGGSGRFAVCLMRHLGYE
ncbi:hypothetical protein [Rubritalea tangerina]|uniref:hypothetical protein n=1 Tax=Rubritalea tangerina TaxID=430798 RepID=UPI00360E765C